MGKFRVKLQAKLTLTAGAGVCSSHDSCINVFHERNSSPGLIRAQQLRATLLNLGLRVRFSDVSLRPQFYYMGRCIDKTRPDPDFHRSKIYPCNLLNFNN
jgi:hypothetical protein